MIWTTTPWTIPANRAIAYGDFAYALVRVDGADEGAAVKEGTVSSSLLILSTNSATMQKLQRIRFCAGIW